MIDKLQERTTFCFSFVAESSLLGVSRLADDFSSSWYFNHSAVFVADNHGVWSPDRTRKVRKKYGKLSKSDSITINDMLLEHKGQVFDKMLKETEEWRVDRGGGRNEPVVAAPVQSPVVSRVENGDENSNGDANQDVAATRTTELNPETTSLNTPISPSQVKIESRLSASPNPMGPSPNRGSVPPMGIFTVTTPERIERERSVRE